MDKEQTYRTLFFILLSALVAIRIFYTYQVRRRGSQQTFGQQAIRREGLLRTALRLVVLFTGLAVVAGYAILPDWIILFDLPVPAWLRWLGFVLGVFALSLLIWVHHTLGRQWSTSLELQQQHRLVTTGPYQWVRHPMYTVLIAAFISLSLVSANLLVALPFVLAIVFMYSRIDKEEAMMVEKFGDEYRAFMAHTGRLLPRWN